MNRPVTARSPRVLYVLKRFPRLSETFILNEVLALEGSGVELAVVSLLARETEAAEHAGVRRVRAEVRYAPGFGRWRRRTAHVRLAARRPGAYARVALDTAAAALRGDGGARKAFRRAVVAADEVERFGADRIHAHFATAATQVAALAARLTDRPFSFSAHAKDIYEIDDAGRERLRRAIADAAFVVTVSEFNRRYLAGLAPAHAAKIHVVANGLDPDWFASSAATSATRRVVEPPLVLAVGRLVEKKGFADLIEACRLLHERGVRFRCRIVGIGPLLGDLRERIARHDLGEMVELAGPCDQDTLRDVHYAAAACVVVPSVVAASGDRDGLPTVVVEAMARGVPVVATAVTAIPEVVVDGGTGLLVPPGDPEALAGAVSRLLADPALAISLADRGRDVAVDYFDRRVTAAKLRQLFVTRGSEPASWVHRATGMVEGASP